MSPSRRALIRRHALPPRIRRLDAGEPLIGGDFELTGGFRAAEIEGPQLIGDIDRGADLDEDDDVNCDDLNLLPANYGP